jgi:hypothetical protein
VPKLLVGVPQHHGITSFYIRGYGQMILHGVPGWEIAWEEVSGVGICVARDWIASRAIQEDFDLVLMLATDIGYTPADVQRLVAHFASDPTLSVVGGCYVKKALPPRLVANFLPGKTPDDRRLIEVKETGTDFMMIRTQVFRDIIHAHPELEYVEDDTKKFIYNIFGMAVVQKRFLTEDWLFCHRARSLGHRIHLDTRVILDHQGSYVYSAKQLATQVPPAPPMGDSPKSPLIVECAGMEL